jgi:formate-nitrite transporter family protein
MTPSSDASARIDNPQGRSQKSHHTILEQQLAEATEELERPWKALFLSALTAGLDLGFGPFAMVAVDTLTADVLSRPVQHLLLANVYTIGFVYVVLAHSALFTEHTTSAVLPVLDRRASPAQLARLWSIVLLGNLLGAFLFSYAAVLLGTGLRITDAAAFTRLANTVIDDGPGVMFASAVAAGWLMGLLTWLTTAARSTGAQLIVIWLTTVVIGLAGLHHSIAGTTEVAMGMLAGAGIGLSDLLRFLALAVTGNAVGGVVFVALLKYGHIRQS